MFIHAHEGQANNFHLLRHAAAFCVVLTHSYSIVTGQYQSEPLVSWTGSSIGHYAVDVFFLLSGFLVTQSLIRNDDLLRFAVGRIVRIFPALIVTVLFTALILGPLVSTVSIGTYYTDPAVWQYIAGSGSTLQTDVRLPGVFTNLPETNEVNIPLWTLKYELAAYLLLGLLVAISRLRIGYVLYGIMLLLLAAYVWGRFQQPWPVSEGAVNNLLHLLPAFFIGSAAFLLRGHIPLGPALTIFLGGVAFLLRDTVAYEIAEKLVFASVVLWLAFLPSKISEAFARRGDYSYGLYILAFPIQQTVFMLHPGMAPLVLFAISTLITLSIAALSWHLIEKPCMGLRDRLTETVRSLGMVRSLAGRRR